MVSFPVVSSNSSLAACQMAFSFIRQRETLLLVVVDRKNLY